MQNTELNCLGHYNTPKFVNMIMHARKVNQKEIVWDG